MIHSFICNELINSYTDLFMALTAIGLRQSTSKALIQTQSDILHTSMVYANVDTLLVYSICLHT